jgi:V8-like Glu-specific endopeptidase
LGASFNHHCDMLKSNRTLWACLTVASLTLTAESVQADPAGLKAAERGVARVVAGPSSGEGEFSTGTGFKIGPGLYVTNRHVVNVGLQDGNVVLIVPSEPGSHPLQAVAHVSDRIDLALLTTGDTPGAPLSFGILPEAGDPVTALGYPGQMDAVLGRGEIGEPHAPDVTVGALINSGLTQDEEGATVTKLVHSANLWPGNSGGPLLDKCDRVVGINTWLHAEGGLAQQDIAISSADVVEFLRENNAAVTLDRRVCQDGALIAADRSPAQNSTPGPSPPLVKPVPQPHSDDNGLNLLLLGAAILGALAIGAVLLITRKERSKRVSAHSSSNRDW